MKVLSLINEKGGVAKTTSTYNLAYCLSKRGYKTLMIDLDYQGSLALACGMEPNGFEKTIADVIRTGSWGSAGDIIHQIRHNLFIVPANRNLKAAFKEVEYKEKDSPEKLYFHLKNALGLFRADMLDYVLIDCHPDFDIAEINALVASDGVIIPCSPDYLPFRGATDFISAAISDIRKAFNPELKDLGILVSRYKKISTDDKVIMQQLKKQFGLIGIVPDTVNNKKGVYDGQCVCECMPTSVIAQEYDAIAGRIIERL